MQRPPNKALELAIALAPAPRVNAKEGHFASALQRAPGARSSTQVLGGRCLCAKGRRRRPV